MAAAARRPGMTDVAFAAGVSHQTVSRVLNEPEKVAAETRQRVEQAIEQLGYRRNMKARALVTRRSGLLGVVLDQGVHYGPSQTAMQIQVAARERGFATLVATLRDHGRGEIGGVFGLFLDHQVEGVIAITPTDDLVDRILRWRGELPMVVVADMPTEPEGVRTVAVDQAAAMRQLTEHVVALGHRDVVHVRGPRGWFDADQREQGWRAALAGAGLSPREPIIGDWSAESGQRAAEVLLRQGIPDAIVAASDLMAIGVMSALGEAGVDVPGRVSVSGLDDIPGTGYLRPSLTTVRQPFDDLGAACVQALADLAQQRTGGPVRIAPQLVVRDSTAARIGAGAIV